MILQYHLITSCILYSKLIILRTSSILMFMRLKDDFVATDGETSARVRVHKKACHEGNSGTRDSKLKDAEDNFQSFRLTCRE